MTKNSTWKSLKKDFAIKDIFDSFIGAFILATLIYAPIAIILVELITVLMYLLTLLVIIIIISLFVYVFCIFYFWWKSLVLKKQEINTDVKKLFLKTAIITNIIVLILGLIFLFVMIPILWV